MGHGERRRGLQTKSCLLKLPVSRDFLQAGLEIAGFDSLGAVSSWRAREGVQEASDLPLRAWPVQPLPGRAWRAGCCPNSLWVLSGQLPWSSDLEMHGLFMDPEISHDRRIRHVYWRHLIAQKPQIPTTIDGSRRCQAELPGASHLHRAPHSAGLPARPSLVRNGESL